MVVVSITAKARRMQQDIEKAEQRVAEEEVNRLRSLLHLWTEAPFLFAVGCLLEPAQPSVVSIRG